MQAPPAWFFLALLCALCWAGVDALCKRALRDHSAGAILGARWWYALPALVATGALAPLPALDRTFWLAVAVSAPLEVAAMFLYLRALEASPLSLTAPLLAWTPVFTTLFSALALREIPSRAGLAGVLLVAGGSWLLYLRRGGTALEPLRLLARERGARLMFAVAVIFSVTSSLGKIGLLHSSAAFFGPAYVGALAVCLTLIEAAKGRARGLVGALKPDRWLVGIGLGVAAMTLLHYAALERTQVAYMVSVKRSSLLASVVIGRVFFGETGLRHRLPGATLMLAGVVLLGLFA